MLVEKTRLPSVAPQVDGLVIFPAVIVGREGAFNITVELIVEVQFPFLIVKFEYAPDDKPIIINELLNTFTMDDWVEPSFWKVKE